MPARICYYENIRCGEAINLATIKDIARQAGVSIATVSRVINGNAGVGEAARENVRNAMREMNYYPNTVARSLKVESTMSLGVIIQDLSNAHLAAFCGGVEHVMSRKGYLPLVATTNNNPETEEKCLRLMLGRRVDALVVHSCGVNNALIAQASCQLPMVAVYRRIDDPDYRGDYVDHENQASSYALTRHLLDNGHRRIFIINGPQNISTGRERFEGFGRAMAEYGLPVTDEYPLRFDSDYTLQGGVEGCRKMLALPVMPTALIATNAETLLGALTYLRAAGIRIPDDLSVVSCASPPNASLFEVQITCAQQDPRTLGEKAGHLLLERLHAHTLPNREVIYPCPIEYGGSVRKIG